MDYHEDQDHDDDRFQKMLPKKKLKYSNNSRLYPPKKITNNKKINKTILMQCDSEIQYYLTCSSYEFAYAMQCASEIQYYLTYS